MRCMILMIVTIGLNILIGHAGLVSLGQAALYGLGAYVAAWLAVKQGVAFLPAVAAGIVATALFGAILAYPTVRVRGVYLAVITIAFGLVFENILRRVALGHRRHAGPDRHSARRGVLGLAATTDLLLGGRRLPDRRFHRPVQHHPLALRPRDARDRAERERRQARSASTSPATRTLAFVISATLAGLAGGLYTFLNPFVNYETFTFFHSVGFLLMVILGGTGTLAGPVVGTSILVYIAEILQDLRDGQSFAYGVLLAAVMFVMPRGIVGAAGELYTRLTTKSRARAPQAWPNRAVPLAAHPRRGHRARPARAQDRRADTCASAD